ncbi:hypothetical protein PAPHI01_1189 [Pancytospora philotis]|nr:hypothetical protein PAPHI01_1189 [Pancytospora philotis]
MNNGYHVSPQETFRGLSNDEIRSVVPHLDATQLDQMAVCLEGRTNTLELQLAANERRIRNETAVVNLLLQRAWRSLDPESKRENAGFFKALSTEINSHTCNLHGEERLDAAL